MIFISFAWNPLVISYYVCKSTIPPILGVATSLSFQRVTIVISSSGVLVATTPNSSPSLGTCTKLSHVFPYISSAFSIANLTR